MKKNKIVVLLVTIITFMGILSCPEPESSVSVYCTVSFDKNGGDSASITKRQVEKGKTLRAKYPADPTRNGYKFDGWYDESVNPNVKYEFNTKITKNLNLKARW